MIMSIKTIKLKGVFFSSKKNDDNSEVEVLDEKVRPGDDGGGLIQVYMQLGKGWMLWPLRPNGMALRVVHVNLDLGVFPCGRYASRRA